MAIIKLTVLTFLQLVMMSNSQLTSKLQSCDATTSSCFREGLHALTSIVQTSSDYTASQIVSITDQFEQNKDNMSSQLNNLTDIITNLTHHLQQANDRITLMQTNHTHQLQQANDRITLMQTNHTHQLQQANDRITLMQTYHTHRLKQANGRITLLETAASNLKRLTAVGVFRDCSEVFKSGLTLSGIYKIYPVNLNNDVHEATVYCNMSTNGGGWTVFQRRQDGSVLFNRKWREYKDGFGFVSDEYWLGNHNIAMMTNSVLKKYKLRIDLEAFDGQTRFAEYTDFSIAPESDNYRLSIGTYSGTAGDSGNGLSYHNNSMFSTYDRDNDQHGGNCSARYGSGGFWFNSCHYVNLNGVYYSTAFRSDSTIDWDAWRNSKALKKTTMMFRPMDFP